MIDSRPRTEHSKELADQALALDVRSATDTARSSSKSLLVPIKKMGTCAGEKEGGVGGWCRGGRGGGMQHA